MPSAADDLLAKMLAAYATCSTYRDEGVVTVRFFGPVTHVQRRPFSTRFVRPDRFLFEFRDRQGEAWDQYAVWTEDGAPRRWWSVAPDRDPPATLALAIAGATGVSGGAARRVPLLLMPELFSERPAASAPRILSHSEAHKHGCIVVERSTHRAQPEQLWIDPATLLLRRVVQPRHPLGPLPAEVLDALREAEPAQADRVERLLSRDTAEVEQITEYQPAFNTPITPRELRFDPPVE